MKLKKRLTKGFTLTELIVVIAIIGVLATIAILSYDAVVERASDSSVRADMDRMKDIQGVYGLDHGISGGKDYVSTNPDSEIDFKASDGNTINVSASTTGYCIRGFSAKGTKTTISDSFELGSSPTACDSLVAYTPPACPTGFIPVPGDSTYGTSDFCVMKYEAKNVGSVATSQAAGAPWVNITQANAKTALVSAGYSMITNAQWLTIAKNVLSVSSNWSGGSVGSGYIFGGNSDASSAAPEAASTDDINGGYYLTGNTAPSNQRRTLTLTNGQTIWDFAGNANEWTDNDIAAGAQPGLVSDADFTWKEWNNGSLQLGGLSALNLPIATGLSGASSWTSANGIGQLYSYLTYASPRVYLRGGAFDSGAAYAGVLSLKLHYPNDDYCVHFGFRGVE